MRGKDTERTIEKRIRKEEVSLLRQWNPEIAIVTIVATLLLLGLAGVTWAAIESVKKDFNSLDDQIVLLNTQIEYYKNASTAKGISYEYLRALADASVGSISLAGPKACALEPGKVNMIIFHSPTCPGCKLQEPALEQALAENAKDVVFWKACVATHSAGDYLSCSREFADGAFAQDALTYVCGNDTKCAANIMLAACQDWNLSVCEQNALRARIKEVQEKNSYTIFGSQAMAMAGQYGVQATPTIVFNCYFKRQGALQQPYEEKLLNDMIQAFVKGA